MNTFEELVAALKALPKTQAHKALRLSHGYDCIWPDDADGEGSEDPHDYHVNGDYEVGMVSSGVYALGGETYWVTEVYDAMGELEPVLYDNAELAYAEAVEARFRFDMLNMTPDAKIT